MQERGNLDKTRISELVIVTKKTLKSILWYFRINCRKRIVSVSVDTSGEPPRKSCDTSRTRRVRVTGVKYMVLGYNTDNTFFRNYLLLRTCLVLVVDRVET